MKWFLSCTRIPYTLLSHPELHSQFSAFSLPYTHLLYSTCNDNAKVVIKWWANSKSIRKTCAHSSRVASLTRSGWMFSLVFCIACKYECTKKSINSPHRASKCDRMVRAASPRRHIPWAPISIYNRTTTAPPTDLWSWFDSSSWHRSAAIAWALSER